MSAAGNNPDQGPGEAESIGRPGPWREGRGQQQGQPIKESVVRKPKEAPPDTISTPVTRRDYESLD